MASAWRSVEGPQADTQRSPAWRSRTFLRPGRLTTASATSRCSPLTHTNSSPGALLRCRHRCCSANVPVPDTCTGAGTVARANKLLVSRYLDNLVGPYPADASTYKERSPINSVEKFSCPLAQFQGLEDKVVPPNQAIEVFDALSAKGVPTVCVLFDGEQHGFRRSANIRRALDSELQVPHRKAFPNPSCGQYLLCSLRGHSAAPPPPLVGVSIGMERERQQNDSLCDLLLQFYGSVFGFEPPMPDDHTSLVMGEKMTVPIAVEEDARA